MVSALKYSGLCYATNMKIIAIDPGYDRVGVAVLEKNTSEKETVVFSTCITTDRKASFYDRLHMIQKELERITKEYQPEQLVLEELYFAKNSPTALRVAEARGIIIGVALEHSLVISEIHPNHVKVAITGHGGANKNDILSMLPKLIAVDPAGKLDDELDAIAIGVAFLAHAKYESLTKV